MATQSSTITADGTTLVAKLSQKNAWQNNEVGIHLYGDFGNGTVTMSYSLDGGTTKIPLVVGGFGGTAVSITDDGGDTWSSPVATNGDPIHLYVTMTGATSPSVNVAVIDQNWG